MSCAARGIRLILINLPLLRPTEGASLVCGEIQQCCYFQRSHLLVVFTLAGRWLKRINAIKFSIIDSDRF